MSRMIKGKPAIYHILLILLLSACVGQNSKRGGRKTVSAFVPEEELLITPTAEPTAEPTPIPRPSGESAIRVNNLHCVCINRTSVDIGDCDAFCSDKTDTSETLYGSITPGVDVLLNTAFDSNGDGQGDLFGWCTQPLSATDTENQNPACQLEFTNASQSTTPIPVNLIAGTNNFTANVQELAKDTNFVVTIREIESTAQSGNFQVYMKDPNSENPFQGLFPTIPVHQYFCVARSGAVINGQLNTTNALKVHFYYHDRLEPDPLSPEEDFLLCHDININPGDDSAAYPRIGLREQDFRLWSRNDLRFEDTGQAYDVNDAANGIPDINDEIGRRLADSGNTVSTGAVNVYTTFNWPTDPSNRESPPIQGLIMVPWINQETNLGFCPVQKDYNQGDAIFQIIKDLGGNVDTEGVYLAVKEKEPFFDADGNAVEVPDDVILVRESLLRQIWFFFDNGTPTAANDITATQKTIRLYWPPRVGEPGNDPLTKQADQKLYTIRAPDEIGSDTANLELQTTVRPSDKRFGCIPVSDQTN